MSYLNDFLRMQQAETIYSKSDIRNQQVERHLHAMKCNVLENLHASHEEMVLPVLAALADEKLDVLQDKQHMIDFMAFFGHQISRTKTFRDSAFAVLSRSNTLEIEVADATEHAWWFLSYMIGMNLGFSLYIDRHNARHALLVNDTNVPFITSDQPVVNVHSCISETEFAAPKHADFYYPISPRVAYIICDSERFMPGKMRLMRLPSLISTPKWQLKPWCTSSVTLRTPFAPSKSTLVGATKGASWPSHGLTDQAGRSVRPFHSTHWLRALAFRALAHTWESLTARCSRSCHRPMMAVQRERALEAPARLVLSRRADICESAASCRVE